MKQKLSHEATRRDEIMQVAARIFATKGYHATTLEEIARELGITKPALYYHVRSKEEILREIINKILEPMEAALKVGKSSLSPKEKIEEIVKILVKFGAERQDTTLIAFEEVKTLPTRSRNASGRRPAACAGSVRMILSAVRSKAIAGNCVAAAFSPCSSVLTPLATTRPSRNRPVASQIRYSPSAARLAMRLPSALNAIERTAAE